MSFKTLSRRYVPFKWVQYVVFWLISFIILSRYFAYQNEVSAIDLIYTGLFHISLIFSVFVNSFVLIPRWLANRKYLFYGLSLIILLLISTWINIYTFRYLTDWIFPGYYFISYLMWTDIIQYIIVYLGITTLLQLSGSWFREAEIKQKLAEAKKEQAEYKLKALRAQINPHFLFNSLNHIYSLSVQQSPKTSAAILQLSDLLRYAIQNTDNTKVALSKELEYLHAFIELYKSRVQYPERIRFTITNSPQGLQIAPLLLIVFIENCFKHGSIKHEEEYIDISITIKGAQLILETQNVIANHGELPVDSNGMGLENAKKRLELLYPGQHQLETKEDAGSYITKLVINLL